METVAHRRLKRLATAWARVQGYSCCAAEVALPHSGFRADVAAYRPGSASAAVRGPDGRMRRFRTDGLGVTAVFECKQSRADLFRDNAVASRAREKLRELQERRAVLERLLRVHVPCIAAGDSLFQEFESIRPEMLDHHGYRTVLRTIAMLQRCAARRTKFERMIQYRCANAHYLVTPAAMIDPGEIPLGWGHLEAEEDAMRLIRRPALIDSPEWLRLGLLHRIARKPSMDAPPPAE